MAPAIPAQIKHRLDGRNGASAPIASIRLSFTLEHRTMSVRRSLAWTYLAQALNFFVTFGSTVVVARLVSPRDFGIYAMATAVTTIINVFMQIRPR